MTQHRLKPAELDKHSDWDGVVKWSPLAHEFIRFTDREGNLWEPVAPKTERIGH